MKPDGWLGEIMGVPVFRVDADTDLPALERHLGEQKRAFYYAKVDADGIERVRRLGALGFFVADTNVVLELDRAPEIAGGFPGVTVGDLSAADEEAVLDVAATAFRYTRFHLDPLVTAGVANEIKRQWCRSYARKLRGDRLFVAKLDGKPAGFLAALKTPSSAVIDLVGVAPAFQRRRVGAALTMAFVEHYRSLAPSLQVGTQIANTPSIRLYERLGFSMMRSQYVLHRHV